MKIGKILKVAGVIVRNVPTVVAIESAARPIIREVKAELKKPAQRLDPPARDRR